MAQSLSWMLLPAIAAGCTCSKLPETCDLLAQREVVIVGTVLDDTGLFRVEKAVRGIDWPGLDVRVRAVTGPICGTPLKRGERWLIFGTRSDEGIVNTHACSGSRRIGFGDQATERLADSFLAGPNVVTGTVRRFGADDGGMADAEVRLIGPEDRSVRTAHDGTFEFAGLTPGEYRMHVQSGGLAPSRSMGSIIGTELRPFRVEARGCVDVSVMMHASQSIRGAIRTRAGRPAVDVLVWLISRDGEISPENRVKGVWTSADGTYEFRRVENGTYVVEAGGETGDDPILEPAPVYSTPFALTGNGAAGVDLAADSARFADVKLRVTRSNGLPLLNATVEVARNGGVTSMPFDSSREWRLLAGEEYSITVTEFPVPGSRPEKGKTTVRITPNAVVEVRLEP